MPLTAGLLLRIKRDHLLQALLLLTLALALLDPRPANDYLEWLDVPTLAGLTGLLVLTQAVRLSGLIQRWALALVARLSSVRALAIVLVLVSALLASLLTNDVALFLVVPLTLAIDAIAQVPRARLVIFEALAVNAGSTSSPIGNPQNVVVSMVVPLGSGNAGLPTPPWQALVCARNRPWGSRAGRSKRLLFHTEFS